MNKKIKKFYKEHTSRRTRKIIKEGFSNAGGAGALFMAAGKGITAAIKDGRKSEFKYNQVFDATTINTEILKLGIEMGIISKDDEERFVRTSSDIGSIALDEENLQLSNNAMILLYVQRICGIALASKEQEKELFIAYISGRRAKE